MCRYHNVDVSVAVQTDFGLMVPIVKVRKGEEGVERMGGELGWWGGVGVQDADKKGLAGISEDVKRLAEKARENKLKPDEFQVGVHRTWWGLRVLGFKDSCGH